MTAEAYFFTSFLPHEPPEGEVGGVTGGTAPAVLVEAKTNHEYASRIIGSLSNHSYPPETQSILDAPKPHSEFCPPVDGLERLSYDLPRDTYGNVEQVWDMAQRYMADEQWVNAHLQARIRPGKHIIFDHHTLGMYLGSELASALPNRSNYLIGVRAHSQFLALTKYDRPDYYQTRYEGALGTQFMRDAQMEALRYADFTIVPTEIERIMTIEALVAQEVLTREQAESKIMTVGIPLDLSNFTPDDNEGTKRMYEIATVNEHIRQRTSQSESVGFIGSLLDPDANYISYVGRLDFEKRPWELAEAYASYLQENWSQRGNFARLLMIGGLTNKPGAAERHAQMIIMLKGLPTELQEYFTITGFPIPHENSVHISAIEIYPSAEEAFNISEKQKRATGGLVALSPVVGHIGTNIRNTRGATDTALWVEPTPDWKSFTHIFEAARNPQQYQEIARAGYRHVQQFRAFEVMRDLIGKLDSTFPGFFQNGRFDKLY